MHNEKLTFCIDLANRLHANQVDKLGQPYILHPLRVMQDQGLKVFTEGSLNIARCVAVLHDVVEDVVDANSFYNMLPNSWGFDIKDTIFKNVLLLTKEKDAVYVNFIKNIMNSGLLYAVEVKRADVRDNDSPGRLNYLDKDTKARLRAKYESARRILEMESYFDDSPF